MARSTCSESSILMYLVNGIPNMDSDSCLWIIVITRDFLFRSKSRINRTRDDSRRACLIMGLIAEKMKNIQIS